MEIAIDIGNTATKVGLFKHPAQEESTGKPDNPTASLRVSDADRVTRLPNNDLTALHDCVDWSQVSACIVCSTAGGEQEVAARVRRWSGGEVVILSPATPLPIRNGYQSPDTVGGDRLAAACAAHFLALEHNGGRPAWAAVIDAGTAITYDLVDNTGTYRGGNISPGLRLRLLSLHEHTAHLPLLEPTDEEIEEALSGIGHTTDTAILCGVVQGIRREMEGFIRQAQALYPDLFVFLTGGNRFRLANTLKNRIFAADFLVLNGLELILRHSLNAHAPHLPH